VHVSIFTGRAVEVSYLLPQSQCCHKGVEFRANLMVLDTKGIDMILGMETLVRWGVRIDCAQRTVHLSALDG
jgi:hypothetical protein